jgi:hypothetical protein
MLDAVVLTTLWLLEAFKLDVRSVESASLAWSAVAATGSSSNSLCRGR